LVLKQKDMKHYLLSGLLLLSTASFAGSTTTKNVHLKSGVCTILDVVVSPDGKITWKTNNEPENTTYAIQQFKWGQWVTTKKVEGKGANQTQEYTDKVFLTSGVNKFRVVTYYLFQPPITSEEITVVSSKKVVTSELNNKSKQITFSDETYYVVKNKFGENVMEGIGNSVNLKQLDKGNYIVCFDNSYKDITI
jgi:hypothetical protein